jgi:hypothetical protein
MALTGRTCRLYGTARIPPPHRSSFSPTDMEVFSMKKIGIIGGIGPESTVDYYNLIIGAFHEKQADLVSLS